MKPARDMTDEELAEQLPGLKARVFRHSPICVCDNCYRYTEVGIEQREREILLKEL